jgi:hypothetical protein
MNKKIFFDLCTYDLDVFKSKLKDIIFLVGVTYFVDIFIVKKSLSFDFRRVKTIPFTLLKTENRDEIIQDLYKIFFFIGGYLILYYHIDIYGVTLYPKI